MAWLLLVNAIGLTCATYSRTQVYPQQVGVVRSKYGIAHELIHAKNMMECRIFVVAVDAAASNRSGGVQRR